MIFLGLSLIFAVIAFAATRRVISTIIVFVLTLLISYGALGTLGFGFMLIPGLLFVTGIIVLIEEGVRGESSNHSPTRYGGAVILLIISSLILLVVMLLTTWAFFHASSYHGLIGEVKESVYTSDTAPVDPTQIRTIDEQVARRLGEKRLGEETALGSQVDLGDMNIQLYRGQLYWVAPLNHSGFFKWFSNRDGTPGYIMVSATNERDVRLVMELDSGPIRLKYNMGSWFGEQPARHLYTNGYATVGLDDYTFEIHDNGKPYYVVTIFEKKIGFDGSDATGVVTLNAQTGEIQPYGIDDAPEWIDRIQPEDFVISQLDDWGMFVHGWWNPEDKDRLKTTSGASLVYDDNGRASWYTGMTSVGADESIVGFVLVDTRTKDVRFYKQTGATEQAARRSAEGSVQEKEYRASLPILYNVNSMPTYFMTLKDNAGLVKLMSFVPVENYQIVGIGDSVQSALRDYRRALTSRGNEVVPDGAIEWQKTAGMILRITKDQKGDATYYYILLEGSENKVFVGSADLAMELILTRPGDDVEIGYDEGGNALVDMTAFDNLRLNFQKSEAQQKVEEQAEEFRETEKREQLEEATDATWENMTPEQKKELLGKIEKQ